MVYDAMHERRSQFRLSQLMLVTAAVAVTFGIVLNFEWLGVFLAMLGWFTAFCYWLPVSKFAGWSLWSCGLLCGIGLVLPAFSTTRCCGSRRAYCSANVKMLTLAINAYHEQHGCYPPPYTLDTSGNKLHSWRTLILPHIEQDHIYEQIKLDEPWDSPHNSQHHDDVVPLFYCPSANDIRTTSYVAVVGPNTAWPEDGVGLKALAATSQTILLVDCADSGIHWMEPRDLHVTQMNPNVPPTAGQGMGGHHTGLAIVGFADTNVRSVDATTDPKIIAKLLSRHAKDKEGVAAFFLQ